MNKEEKEAINRLYDVTHLTNGEHTEYIDIDNIATEEEHLDSCKGFCKATDIVLNLIKRQEKEIQKLRKKNNDLLSKLRNRIKQVNKLAKYSNYKKEFSNLNKKIEKQKKEIKSLSKKLYLCTPEIPQHEHQEYVSYVDLINKIIKLEKIIEKMAEEILKIDTAKSKFEYDHAKVWDTEKGIKEYFK
ncbi:MAG: hypothetical protein J6N78_04200, partial [Clostridia bacterium]|nr:hypothetical protein [Clostridia bacterium]